MTAKIQRFCKYNVDLLTIALNRLSPNEMKILIDLCNLAGFKDNRVNVKQNFGPYLRHRLEIRRQTITDALNKLHNHGFIWLKSRSELQINPFFMNKKDFYQNNLGYNGNRIEVLPYERLDAHRLNVDYSFPTNKKGVKEFAALVKENDDMKIAIEAKNQHIQSLEKQLEAKDNQLKMVLSLLSPQQLELKPHLMLVRD